MFLCLRNPDLLVRGSVSDPGSCAILTPGSGIGFSGSRISDPKPLFSGLEKTRVFKKKNQPSGFFGVFWVFWGFFAQTRGLLGYFSVSQILLGASRL
jgi:hypothetical protein